MFDLETTLLAITIVIYLSLTVFVFSKDRKSAINVSFALFVLFLSFWAITILVFRLIASDATAVYFLKLSYISAVLIAACFYYFSLVFPDGKHPSIWHRWSIILGTGTLSAALLMPTFLTGAVSRYPWGRVVELHLPEYLIFAAVFCALFLGGQVRIWSKYAAAADLVRKQLLAVGLSVTVVGIVGMYYNLFLPSPFYEDFRYVWTGPIFTSAFALVITYSIFRYKLFDTKALVAELLVFSLWLFIFIRALIASTPGELFADAALLIVTVPVGILLLRSVKVEVRAREEMDRANCQLKELDRMKSEFLSIATHQLRAPVAAIRGYASLIQEGTYGAMPDAAQEAVGRIAESSQALSAVIDDYLSVSRIEQGRLEYQFAVVDLKKIVERTVREIMPMARSANVEITFETDSQGPYEVKVDAEKIRQVIFNLLDNAIKYTPKGSIQVRITKDASHGTLLLAMRDTGVGIDAATLPRLFQRFSRASDAGKTNAVGTGLGLYVAKQLVEAHGGRIWAESNGKGRGSIFFVELPEIR